MPIYEYSCKKCKQIFEEWTKHIDSAEGVPCPICGSPSERVISHTSFVLKGGGWYVTDYGYKSKQGQAKAPTQAASTPAAAPAEPKASAAPAAGAPSAGSGATPAH